MEARICAAIDSASDQVVAALLMTMGEEKYVPVEAVRPFVEGKDFARLYGSLVEVEDRCGKLYVNWPQFNAVRIAYVENRSVRELKNVSEKHSRRGEKLFHSDGKTTIRRRVATPKNGHSRTSKQFYFRTMVQGEEIFFPVGPDGRKGLVVAREIKSAIGSGGDVYSLLKKFHPNSKLMPLYHAKASNPPKSALKEEINIDRQMVGAPSRAQDSAVPKDLDPPLHKVAEVYLRQAEGSRKPPSAKTAKGNILQLRKLLRVALTAEKGKPITDQQLFELPVSCLNESLVDRFQDAMLDQADDYLDEMRISNSANSTLRQAKSLFSKSALALYRKDSFAFTFPEGFMRSSALTTADANYSLPEFSTIQALFDEMPALRKSDRDHYLLRLLGLFVGLRPGEIKWLRKAKVVDSGYWKVCIEVTQEFIPKKYQIRRIRIPRELGQHIQEVCADNGSEFVLGGHMTFRTIELFDVVNHHLREHFLHGVRRPTYELRKVFASSCWRSLGMDVTHRRMGHKNRTTTEKYYVDSDTPKELVELFERAARNLFGGPPFAPRE
ncbi:MAG: site-specific integrase [Opitutales bacterium]